MVGAWSGDLLVLGIFEEQLTVEGTGDAAVASLATDDIISLDDSLGGIISELIAEGDFKGKVRRFVQIYVSFVEI